MKSSASSPHGSTEPDDPPLEDALRLVHLYAERGSPKYEKAALRWLGRYLTEGAPRLERFAEVAGDLARHESQRGFLGAK